MAVCFLNIAETCVLGSMIVFAGVFKGFRMTNFKRNTRNGHDFPDFLKRPGTLCEDRPIANDIEKATCLILRDCKEVWLCKKHFDIECDRLQETLRETTDLRPWYGKKELVLYE